MMIRFLPRVILWSVVYLVTLCAITIEADYDDGLKLKFHGWLTWLLHGRK